MLALLGANRTVLMHAAKHVAKTLLCPLRMPGWVEKIWTFCDPGEQRAFGQGQFACRFPEVASRGDFNPRRPSAENDRIQVKLQAFRLAESSFDPGRQDHLAHLALIADLIPHQQIFHDLLSDRRATLRATRLHEISDETADERTLVDAVVLIEALVLGGDERLLHVGWNIDKVDPDPPLVGLIHFPKAFTFGVEHLARAAQTPSLEACMVGQVDHRSVIKFDYLFEANRGAGNAFVLAELPVGDMQIGDL